MPRQSGGNMGPTHSPINYLPKQTLHLLYNSIPLAWQPLPPPPPNFLGPWLLFRDARCPLHASDLMHQLGETPRVSIPRITPGATIYPGLWSRARDPSFGPLWGACDSLSRDITVQVKWNSKLEFDKTLLVTMKGRYRSFIQLCKILGA